MRSHGLRTRILVLGIFLVSLMACNEADGPELATLPHFPQSGERTHMMEALLEGKLVLKNGCLRLESMSGTDHPLIWPKGFRLTVDDRGIQISDDSGASLSVGEELRIGGGEVPMASLQSLAEQPVLNDCPGPYWVIGEIQGH